MLIKREYVRLRNFLAVWKGRDSDQELSAELIRAPVEVAGTPPLFDQSFFFKHISFFELQ